MRALLAAMGALALAVATATPAQAQAPQSKAYITHSSGVVSTVDAQTDTVTGSIPVAPGAAKVVVSRDGARAYTLSASANSISVIDVATDSTVATIPVGTRPLALAVTPDGTTAYVAIPGTVAAPGFIQVVSLATGEVTATINVGVINGGAMTNGDSIGIAISADGTRAYVAGGALTSIDTATNTVIASMVPNMPPPVGGSAISSATNVVLSPDGSRAYVGMFTNYFFADTSYALSGGLSVVDTATLTQVTTIAMPGSVGAMAMTPDGSRGFATIDAIWVNEGIVQSWFPGRWVMVFDTRGNEVLGGYDLGASGQAWTLQNTGRDVAVAPDRSKIYVPIPRISSVAVIPVNGAPGRGAIAVTASPLGAAFVPDANASLVPYVVDAIDDAALETISNVGGTVFFAAPDRGPLGRTDSVLYNDRFGGFRPILANVTLSQVSSTTAGLSLDATTGVVTVAPGTEVGTQTLVYEMCDATEPTNCDQASVSVVVRLPYVINAVDDSTSSLAGRQAIASVLSNDTLNGAAATTSTVTMTQVAASHVGILFNSATGAVSIAAGTPVGLYTVEYQICETASLTNCDSAIATVNVIPVPLDAVDDAGTITRAGGTAVANVLANDRFNGAVATTASVALAQMASSNPGVSLNVVTGAVQVADGTAIGTYTLTYRICETASPANCDSANVTVAVTAYVVDAVNDAVRGSSKAAATLLASVLSNDTFGGRAATTAAVTLQQVSLTPANPLIQLDTNDGSIDLLGSTLSGIYTLVYRICETASPANCDTATATVDLSGSGGTTTTFKLTVKTNGNGTVTSNPAGQSFASGTAVTLTATPKPGSPWVGWSGACTGTATTCTVIMNQDKTVTANFR